MFSVYRHHILILSWDANINPASLSKFTLLWSRTLLWASSLLPDRLTGQRKCNFLETLSPGLTAAVLLAVRPKVFCRTELQDIVVGEIFGSG